MALMRLEGDEGSDESREEKERAREGGREGARGSCQEDLRLPSTDPDAAVFPNHSMCACMSVCARTHILFSKDSKKRSSLHRRSHAVEPKGKCEVDNQLLC